MDGVKCFQQRDEGGVIREPKSAENLCDQNQEEENQLLSL